MSIFLSTIQSISAIVFSSFFILIFADFLIKKLLTIKYFKSKEFSILDGTLLDSKPVIPDSYKGDGEEWYLEYALEAKNIFNSIRWRPYTYWSSAQYNGKYINIGSKGWRKTTIVNAEHSNKNVITIYMLGGSTLWGWGARDDYTIPSYIAKQLYEQHNVVARVVNLGELGYVSTQNMILLIRELQRGAKPDLVVSYEGLNDSFVSYQLKRPGMTQNEPNREFEFNLKLFDHFKKVLKEKSGFCQLCKKFFKPRVNTKSLIKSNGDSRISQNTVDLYFNNLKIMYAVGLEFGYQLLAYWQPVIFDKITLSKSEQNMKKSQEFWSDFYSKIKRSLENKVPPKYFKNLSGFFADYNESAFIDPWHVDENANRKIAAIITEDIVKKINIRENISTI